MIARLAALDPVAERLRLRALGLEKTARQPRRRIRVGIDRDVHRDRALGVGGAKPATLDLSQHARVGRARAAGRPVAI